MATAALPTDRLVGRRNRRKEENEVSHISQMGFIEDADSFITVKCGCGSILGPAPDPETALDMAMEHAYHAGLQEGRGD